MKRFVSHYSNLLRWRQREEEQRRGELIAMRRQRDEIESMRNQLQQKLQQQTDFCRQQMISGITGGLLSVMEMELDNQDRYLKQVDQVLLRAEAILAEALQKHLDARSELKVVEELVHRERTEHHKKMLKAEELQNQERAMQTFYRNQALQTEAES